MFRGLGDLVEFAVDSVTRVVTIPNLAGFPVSSISSVAFLNGLRDDHSDLGCISVTSVVAIPNRSNFPWTP